MEIEQMNSLRNWGVDSNWHEGMSNGSSIIVRDVSDGDNGIGQRLMIIGIDNVNSEIEAGLCYEDAVLIASAPFMQDTIAEILSLLNGDKYSLQLIKSKLFNALIRSGYEMEKT